MYYKKKLGRTKFIYNTCFFFRYELLKIVRIQIDNILILANNNFASIEKKYIKYVKIITKNRKNFTFVCFLKFNDIENKLDSNNIILAKKVM